jgi:hypothetical protein
MTPANPAERRCAAAPIKLDPPVSFEGETRTWEGDIADAGEVDGTLSRLDETRERGSGGVWSWPGGKASRIVGCLREEGGYGKGSIEEYDVGVVRSLSR